VYKQNFKPAWTVLWPKLCNNT